MKHAFAFGCILLIGGAHAQSFTNNSASLPGTYNSGNCVGFTDADNDGFDDIVVLDQSRNLIILYQDGTGAFTEQAYGQVSNAGQWGMCIADYDNDGHKDVYCGGSYDGVHVWNINAIGDASVVALANDQMFMQACNFADIDNDGQLDAFGCHDDGLSRMWRGEGEALTIDASLMPLDDYALNNYPGNDHSGNYGTVWSDFDNDGDLDLMIAKCRQFVGDPNDPRRINQLWVNDGSNNYTEEAESRGLVLNEQSWTADFADVDNDGDFDCFITNHSTTMKLMLNDGQGYFTDVTPGSGLDVSGFVLQAKLADFDNDGFNDVVLAGGVDGYYHNNGDLTFTPMNVFPANDDMHSFAIGDVNRDGTLDLYASYGNGYNSPDNANPDRLWTNDGNDNHWIAFDLQGIASNMDAVGAKVTITGAFGTQVREVRSGESYGITNSFACHFGLGMNESVDAVVIDWPSGFQTEIDNPEIDVYHNLLEAPCITEVTIDATNLQFCPGESVDLSVLGDFTSYSWSGNSGSEATLSVSEAGTFSVTVTDANGCMGVSAPVSVVEVTGESPQLSFEGDTNLCEGDVLELNIVTVGEWTWSNDAVGSTLAVTESGIYSAFGVDLCGNTLSSDEVEVIFNPTPDAPSAIGNEFVNEGESITITGGSPTLRWYDDEFAITPIAEGAMFTTPALSVSTTYWVEEVASTESTTGMGGESDMDMGQYHTNDGYYMLFDVYETAELVSVKVYANGSGVRQVELRDATGASLYSADFDLTDGTNVIELDWLIEPGSNYGLKCNADDPQLWRDGNGSDLNYPYALGTLGAITSSTVTGANALNYYYFFYDWVLATPSTECPSDRIPVLVTVLDVVELDQTIELSAFPNPAQDELRLRWNSTDLADICVTDVTGRLIERLSAVPSGTVLDVADWTSGHYQVQVSTARGASLVQLMVE